MQLTNLSAVAIQSCPICGNPADKTNAHLIPWFIIKHYITHGGSGTRDKELSFTISSGHFMKLYSGRSVLPETLQEFGDLHALEKEEANPYSRDHLWCTKCEVKFARLETIFSTHFNENRIRQNFQNVPKHGGQGVKVDENFDNSIYQTFIQSIFWRCSVGKFDGFTLDNVIEKKIEQNLREAFKSANFLKLKAVDILPIVHSFPLITSILYSEQGEDQTKNFILINNVRTPYFIMAGKWLFQLFEKEKHIKGTHESLFGLRVGMDINNLYSKIAGKSHVILLDKQTTDSFVQRRLEHFVAKKVSGIQSDIRVAHLKMFGHKPDSFIQSYILQQYFAHRDFGKSEFESFVLAFYDLKKLP